MKKSRILAALVLATPLMAGGEYDSAHLGFRFGIAWSPDKSYGGLGSPAPGTKTLVNDKMQLAPTVGLHFNYAAVPGIMNVGLLADYVRPIHKEAGVDSGSVSQNLIRGELRFQFSTRGNVEEGMNWFISPTYTWVNTSSEKNGDLKEKKMGAALGLDGMSFKERYKTYWEAAFYYLPTLDRGSKAGNLTLELRVGWLF